MSSIEGTIDGICSISLSLSISESKRGRIALYRFATLFGTFSIMRLAFASERFLISSLIFSIRLLVSGL
jgi:hypothetical protein